MPCSFTNKLLRGISHRGYPLLRMTITSFATFCNWFFLIMQLLSEGNEWFFLVSLVSLMPNSTAWKANPLSFILYEKGGLKDAISLGARSYKNLLGSQCSKQFDCLCCLKFWPWWHEYHMWDEHPHGWWLTLVKRPMDPHAPWFSINWALGGAALSWRGPWPFGAFLLVQRCHEI